MEAPLSLLAGRLREAVRVSRNGRDPMFVARNSPRLFCPVDTSTQKRPKQRTQYRVHEQEHQRERIMRGTRQQQHRAGRRGLCRIAVFVLPRTAIVVAPPSLSINAAFCAVNLAGCRNENAFQFCPRHFLANRMRVPMFVHPIKWASHHRTSSH